MQLRQRTLAVLVTLASDVVETLLLRLPLPLSRQRSGPLKSLLLGLHNLLVVLDQLGVQRHLLLAPTDRGVGVLATRLAVALRALRALVLVARNVTLHLGNLLHQHDLGARQAVLDVGHDALGVTTSLLGRILLVHRLLGGGGQVAPQLVLDAADPAQDALQAHAVQVGPERNGLPVLLLGDLLVFHHKGEHLLVLALHLALVGHLRPGGAFGHAHLDRHRRHCSRGDFDETLRKFAGMQE